MRSVAIVNLTSLLGGDDVSRCVAALQTQVSRDFAGTWGIDAQLRVTGEADDDEEIIYLLDDAAQADALGHAARQAVLRPRGFVLVKPCLDAGASWQVRLSHVLLEMLADPLGRLSAEGIHAGRPALFALDIGDPVQTDEYEIAGVAVSNFVLPTWYVPGPLADDALVDFLGRLSEPFTLSPGGMVQFATELGRWQSWFAKRCPKERRTAGAFSRRKRRTAR
jgi:hypothetical protein